MMDYTFWMTRSRYDRNDVLDYVERKVEAWVEQQIIQDRLKIEKEQMEKLGIDPMDNDPIIVRARFDDFMKNKWPGLMKELKEEMRRGV